jgi:hypothetical protein
MSDVTVQLVREFFELNAFHVMTYWQHDSGRVRGTEHGLQLFVENTAPSAPRPLDLVLRIGDVSVIPRALVEVRAWHADRFYASVVESNPVLIEVAGEESLERARRVFGGADMSTILVISELPTSLEPRQHAVNLLHEAGISHVIEFPTILQEILEKINANVSYAPSHTLQTMRLLKRYNFLRRQQLEFPFPTEPPVSVVPPEVETAEEAEDDSE